MKQMTLNNRRGLTLTELLAVLMILSLLTTIAVPVYVARQEDARVRVAITECREIAMAEDTVAAMHGVYVPFQLLDDLPPRPDQADGAGGGEERINRNPWSDDLYLINASIRAQQQYDDGNQLRLGQGYDPPTVTPANPIVRRLVQNWSGPFITFQRFWYDVDAVGYAGPSDPDYRLNNDLYRDFPLDPWGNPYRFYSPIGAIGSHSSNYDAELFQYDNPDLGFSDGMLQINNDDERFQRFAVVSFGRDGVSDTYPTLPGPNDILNDIYYEFGTDGLSRNFGKF